MTCNASEFTIKNGVLLKYHEQKETIIVPDGVTQIGDYVFEDFFDTKQIILPDGLIKIGWDAFHRCKSLKSIIIPPSVTKIERGAFKNSGIEHITLPPGLREISDELFQYSEIREIRIPEGVERIRSRAFDSCHSLEKVVLPDSLKEISYSAFHSCERLKQINLPQTTAVFGNSFGMCVALADENGFIILNKTLYESPAMYKEETVVVPDGVEVLNQATPTANSDIRYMGTDRRLIYNFCRTLVIPESVKNYGPCAFYSEKVKTIISRSPARLGPLAFSSCESLRKLTVRHDVEISKNLFSYNQQDNEKAMQRLQITYTDPSGQPLPCSEPIEKSEIANVRKGEQSMNYSNYESVNPTRDATEQKWCISLGKVTPQQVSVKLDGGKTFPYVSRFGTGSDDAVVIGKQYAYMSACEHGEANTTGKFGVVTELSDNITAKKANLVELDMVFTHWFDKKTLAACAKYLALPANETSLQYGKNTEKIYPITFMIRKVLAAASILAHPDLAGAKAMTAAKEYLAAEQKIPTEAQELRKAWPEYSDIPLWDIYVPNPNRCKDELAGIPLVHSDMIDRFSKGAEIPEKIQQYVHKYVHIGAISVMIRGGFKNLLEAYLGANPPISEFYEDALADIGTHGYAELMQIFKNHFSSGKKGVSSTSTQPAPAQDKPVVKSAEPVKSSVAPAAEATSFTGCIGDFKIRDNRLSKYLGKDSHITIPDCVTSIGKDAFLYCSGITSVTIPNSVTTIEERAFFGCDKLTDITIPDSVTRISKQAFQYCSNLSSISLSKNIERIYSNLFAGCAGLKSIVIPDGVKEIGDSAFKNCTSLSSVTIPDSVKRIGEGAFKTCTSLDSIALPVGMKKISWYVFAGCTSLSSITIPNSVIEIGPHAFEDCTGLISIVIPHGVKKIGSYAFEGCTNLNNITIPDSVKEIGWRTFKGCHKLADHNGFVVVRNVLFDYVGLKSSIVLPDSVIEIGPHAFEACTGLISIVIPHGVKKIGSYAFEGCTSLSSITIPNSVKEINYCAFEGCTSLNSITIPDNVKEIGQSAFEGCTSLNSITIPDNVKEIGQSAFEGCSHLTICGSTGCYAEKYAAELGIPFMDEETRQKAEEEARRHEEARKNAIYDRAKRLMMTKYPMSITEAAALFSTISGWRDADELKTKCPERAEKARIYQKACEKMNGMYIVNAINEGAFKAAIELFETIKDWEDSEEQINYCLEKLEEARKNEIYDRAKRLMMSKNPAAIIEAASEFFTIPGWRDADELKAKCPDRAEKAKIYQNACDKMNGVHIEGSGNAINEESCRAAIKIFETIKDWEDSEEQIRCCLEKIKAQQIARQTDLIAQKSKLGLFAGKQKKELQAQIDALQTEIDAVNEAINRLKK